MQQYVAGTTTYNVGVIPKNSQLLTTTIRVAVEVNRYYSNCFSWKTGTAAIFIANTDVKARRNFFIANGALDEADRFG